MHSITDGQTNDNIMYYVTVRLDKSVFTNCSVTISSRGLPVIAITRTHRLDTILYIYYEVVHEVQYTNKKEV